MVMVVRHRSTTHLLASLCGPLGPTARSRGARPVGAKSAQSGPGLHQQAHGRHRLPRPSLSDLARRGRWLNRPDVWEIDGERVYGGPIIETAITAHPGISRYRNDLRLHSAAAGAAIRFAGAMLEPGRVVICGTETTDLYGAVCEIAVIDAATGK